MYALCSVVGLSVHSLLKGRIKGSEEGKKTRAREIAPGHGKHGTDPSSTGRSFCSPPSTRHGNSIRRNSSASEPALACLQVRSDDTWPKCTCGHGAQWHCAAQNQHTQGLRTYQLPMIETQNYLLGLLWFPKYQQWCFY
ncbi:hypothetical protein KIL84_005222 [Mauremys mutica]|uniref:Uncharacterized protein n=1 Tax=Mauremys mutica TaxID=74926 RepID=A0A9D3XKJ0_9SAUR|nr:hypothetical protein KIL84_005222 [Mauremys mutica]